MTIKQTLSTVLATIGVVSLVALALPVQPAAAVVPPQTGGGTNDSGQPGKCGSYSTSIIPCPSGSGESAISGLLLMAINILAVGVGIAAVGGVVYAAILYTTAEDKPAQVSKAKTIIFNVVLGVAAYFLMYSFLQFIVPGGVFH